MAKVKYTKEEIKQKRKEQKQKEALRCYRLRPLKNFFIWLTGFVSAFVILITGIFVGVKFIPISTYVGDTGKVVSKDISSKSILDAIMGVQTYDMSDFPFVADALVNFLDNTKIDNKKLSDIVQVDKEKILSLKFNDSFATEIQSCIKVVATLDSLGALGALKTATGIDISTLDIFNAEQKVSAEQMPDLEADGSIKKQEGKLLSNPHLYYYKTPSNEFFRAFDNDGKKVEGAQGDLYYPNLAKIPLLEMTQVMSESFGRVSINSLLALAGGGSDIQNSLLGNILDGKTISDLEKISQKDILFVKILPYRNAEEGIDNSQMYKIILQACGNDISGLDDAEIEALASGLNIDSFNDLDFYGIPIKSFGLDDSTLKILFDAVNGKIQSDNEKLKPGEEAKPLLTNLSDLTIEKLTSIDPNYITLTSVIPYKNATENIDNSELYKIILQACGNDIAGKNDAEIEALAKGLNIDSFGSLDFYDISIETFGLDNSTLQILFDAVNGKIQSDNEKLKPGEQATPLLTNVSQLKVNHLKSIDPSFIKLSTVLPYKTYEGGVLKVDNSQLYKIILQACGNNITGLNETQIEEMAKELGINTFESFNEQNITLNTILPADKVDEHGNLVNKGLYDILLDMVNANKSNDDKKTASEITISDLSTFDQNSIRLSTILPLTKQVGGETIDINTDLYNILSDIVNGTKPSTDVNYVKKEDITIEHLSKFDYGNIKLSTILKIDSNVELYNILNDIINGDKKSGDAGYVKPETFTISNLSNFEYNKIKLNTVMPKTTQNQALYDILLDIINKGVQQGQSGYKGYESITVNDLSTFSYTDLHLSTILPISENPDIYEILKDATGFSAEQITIGVFSDFKISDIHLSTFLEDGGDNKIVQSLLAKNPTVDKIGTAINSLSLYEVYGTSCFVKRVGDVGSNVPTYDYSKDAKGYETYTLNQSGNGEYVINGDAGIWLLLCYEPAEGSEIVKDITSDYYGCRTSYAITQATFKDLQNGADISTSISGATVKELITIGLISSSVNQYLYAQTLQDALVTP